VQSNNYDSIFQNCQFIWKDGTFTFEKIKDHNDKENVNSEAVEEDPHNVSALEEEKESEKENQINDDQLNQFEGEVVKLTNLEREKLGLSSLKIDSDLSKVAREKSHDMSINGYFDHN